MPSTYKPRAQREIVCNECNKTFMGRSNRKYCEPCRQERAYKPKPRKHDNCICCGADITDRYPTAKYCVDCAEKIPSRKVRLPPLNDNEMARKLTNFAVKIGFLPHPSEFDCVDCKSKKWFPKNKPAECYDHRDYSKPLDVEPVCLQCNSSRGRGIPFFSHNKEHKTKVA